LGGSTDAEIVMSDVAFASSEKLDSVTLKDGNGQAVQFAVEPLADDGAVVIRTDATLTPGRYTLTANCQEFGASQRTLIVGEAAPLPTKLGTLTQQFTDSSCDSQPSLVFTLELDPAAVPYAALLELSVSVDGGEPFLWAPFGSLSAEASSTLSLVLDRCSSAADQKCVPAQMAQLELHTRVAGEMDELEPVQLAVDGSCEPPPSEKQCAYAPTRVQHCWDRGTNLILTLGVLAVWVVRRRKRT
jgi:hypothetical protein